MRLNPGQVEAIKQETERFFGAQAEAWPFGSRVDGEELPVHELARRQGVKL